jgi:hypothetical protein
MQTTEVLEQGPTADGCNVHLIRLLHSPALQNLLFIPASQTIKKRKWICYIRRKAAFQIANGVQIDGNKKPRRSRSMEIRNQGEALKRQLAL